MTLLLIACVAGLAAAILLRALSRTERFFEYPALAAAVYLGWVLPQNLMLLRDLSVPEEAHQQLLLMELLCLVGICLGWRKASPNAPRSAVRTEPDLRRLLVGFALLTIQGYVFWFMLWRLPPELIGVSNWSGLPVAYLFFASTTFYAAVGAWLIWLRTRDVRALVLAIAAVWPTADAAIFAIRRQEAVSLALGVLTGLWLVRRVKPPKAVIVAGLFLAPLLIASAGHLRSISFESNPEVGIVRKERRIEDVAAVPFLDGLFPSEIPWSYELKNAALGMAAASHSRNFDLGTWYWDRLVFAYVPAQLLGKEFKDALMVGSPDIVRDTFMYEATVGQTFSGFRDAYTSFWFFGSVVFFFISRAMRYLWDRAANGSYAAQLFYIVMMTDAMVAITHETAWLVMRLPHVLLFLLPILRWARSRSSDAITSRMLSLSTVSTFAIGGPFRDTRNRTMLRRRPLHGLSHSRSAIVRAERSS